MDRSLGIDTGVYKDKPCQYCEEDFSPVKAGQRYCSKQCQEAKWKRVNLLKQKEERTVTVICKGCDTEFRTPNQKKQFCTVDCRWAYFNKKRPTTKRQKRECPVCTKMFNPMQTAGVGRMYCSTKCKSKAAYERNRPHQNKKALKDRKNYKYDGNWWLALERDKFTCQLCGKQMHPSQWAKTGLSRIVVHHMDVSGEKDVKNHSLDNLISYCGRCHKLFHNISLVFLDGKYYIEGEIFKRLGITELKVAEEAESED